MRAICVTGMHRSGTSLLARMVNLLGVDLGDSEKILPPGADNLAGYWERRDALKVNNDLLDHFGGSWDRLPHLPAGWEHRDDLADLRVQALSVLEAFSDDAEVVGWKDPRLSILLPFWRTIVDIDRTVVAIRHPAAVAASLQRRNGITLQHATVLWLRYTLEALLNDPDALVLRYTDMLADSEGLAHTLVEHLRLPEPDSLILEQIRDFVQPKLAHQTEQFAPDSPELRFATEIFEEILAGPDERDLERFRALVASWNEAAHSVGGQVADLQGRLEEQRDQTRRYERQLIQLRKDSPRRINEAAHGLEKEKERTREQSLVAEFERARTRRLRFELKEAKERIKQNRSDYTRIENLERELQGVRRRYNQMRNRHSVRFATGVARIVRPILLGTGKIRNRVQRQTGAAGEKDADSGKNGEKSADHRPGSVGKSKGQENGRAQEPQKGTARPIAPPQVSHSPAENARKEDRPSIGETDALLGALRDAAPVTVVVPIHNAVDDLRRCVESIRRNTTFPAELLLIDDASTDPRVGKYLDGLEGVEGVCVLRNSENRGFSGTVNRGIRESAGDVVALNSDTEVTPRWLTNLALAAYEDSTIGSVTPLSDNAGAFSVPERGKRNATPEHLSADEVGRLVTRTSRRVRPDTPTANGVCMYLKRAMLDTMDLFDEESFPRGYGEENDFCMRASKAGWRHIVDDATLVFHAGSMSFGGEKQALLEAGLAKVAELHPEYQKLVQPFLHGSQMRTVREVVGGVYKEAPPRCLPRVLHVIHRGAGGVQFFNDDLARGLQDRYEHFQLLSDADSLTLRRFENGQWHQVERHSLDPSVTLLDDRHEGYRREATRILNEYGIEVVHLQSLIQHAHDLPMVADAMGLAVVATLHDYFLVCPTIQLIDDRGRFCGGTCTPGQGKCRTAFPWVVDTVPHLKHAWVHEWQRNLTGVLQATDVLVAPTEAVRQTYLKAYPGLEDRLEVVEHGLDVPEARTENAPPQADGPVRLLVLGNINDQKGAQVLSDVLALDEERGDIELHILGAVAPDYRTLGRQHGPYEREKLHERVSGIKPAVVALLSPWGETFCYTLTEAWSCGLPVVAADVGALGERVRAEGAGWVVDPHEPEAVYETILRTREDGESYRRAAEAARAHRPRTVAEMSDDYDDLYRAALVERGISSLRLVSGAAGPVGEVCS